MDVEGWMSSRETECSWWLETISFNQLDKLCKSHHIQWQGIGSVTGENAGQGTKHLSVRGANLQREWRHFYLFGLRIKELLMLFFLNFILQCTLFVRIVDFIHFHCNSNACSFIFWRWTEVKFSYCLSGFYCCFQRVRVHSGLSLLQILITLP